MSFKRHDKTFIKLLKKRLEDIARFRITTTIYTIISKKSGCRVTLDVIGCLRRSVEDHEDMVHFVQWKIAQGEECQRLKMLKKLSLARRGKSP